MASLRESAVALFRDLDLTRKLQDKAVKAMNSTHSELAKTAPHKAEKLDADYWKRLRAAYKKALECAKKEESLCLLCLKELESLSVPAQAQSRKYGKGQTQDSQLLRNDFQTPPHCQC